MDKGKIILDELNEWVYNDENSCGTIVHVIDSSDLPKIVEAIVKKLNTEDESKQFYCFTKRGCLEQCTDCTLAELEKR